MATMTLNQVAREAGARSALRLTKREIFAAHAMQGLLAAREVPINADILAKEACAAADALTLQLLREG